MNMHWKKKTASIQSFEETKGFELTAEQADQQIDAALRAAGHAKIPAGLAERVTLRMQQSSAMPIKKGYAQRIRLLPVLSSAVAAALLMAIGLQITLRLREGRKNSALRQSERQEIAENLNVKSQAIPKATDIIAFPVKNRVYAKDKPRESWRAQHYELLSYPLTHQERLLLQLARTIDPKEVQMLNSGYRPVQVVKSETEFATNISEADKTIDSQNTGIADIAVTAMDGFFDAPINTLKPTIINSTITEEKGTL